MLMELRGQRDFSPGGLSFQLAMYDSSIPLEGADALYLQVGRQAGEVYAIPL